MLTIFRKKRVLVEVMQWVGYNFDEAADFVRECAGLVCVRDRLLIMTQGEELVVDPSDWVIRVGEYQFEVLNNEEFVAQYQLD